MPTMTLVVRPDGRAILTCARPLPMDMLAELRDQIHSWEEGRWPVAVIADCEVVQVASIEIDLGEGTAPSGPEAPPIPVAPRGY